MIDDSWKEMAKELGNNMMEAEMMFRKLQGYLEALEGDHSEAKTWVEEGIKNLRFDE